VRALVTGAAGFVGRHLTKLLRERGHAVTGLVHPNESGVDLGVGVERVAVDLLDDRGLGNALEGAAPEMIFHLAAYSNPEGSRRQARQTLEVNVIGTENLLSSAAAGGGAPRTLLIGSSQQYGLVGPEAQPIGEDAPQRPLSPYAVSKASQELLGLQYFLTDELPVYLTRSFNHTGPGQADGYVCSSFARQVVEAERGLREPLIRVGNLEARRDFTDVRDVAAAYLAIVERGRPGLPYNVCRGEAVSIRQVLDRLVALASTGVEVRVDEDRYHAVDVPLMLGDSRRLREETGWAPSFSLEATLEDLLEDWRARL